MKIYIYMELPYLFAASSKALDHWPGHANGKRCLWASIRTGKVISWAFWSHLVGRSYVEGLNGVSIRWPVKDSKISRSLFFSLLYIFVYSFIFIVLDDFNILVQELVM